MKSLIIKTIVGVLALSIVTFANTLPKLAYKQYKISKDSNPTVHRLVKEGGELVYPKPRKARKLLVEALRKVSKGAKIDKYDYLWTQYGLLKSAMESGTSKYGPGTRADYMKVAKNVMKFLDHENVGEWQFTELGAFQMEVCREAGNGLGWELMEEGKKLKTALQYTKKAEDCMRGEEDYFIYDTKVRILLKMKKKNKAYTIVKQILNKDPDFGDFQDIKHSKSYRKWLKK